MSIMDVVGGTPLVELRSIVPGGCARVVVKLESHNPTGSMKDRMALSVIDGAVASGRLSASGTVVEYTGGSTESPVLTGGAPGAHKIEGIGPGFTPPMWSAELADEIMQVSTAEATDMARRLAREEALFAGTSSGANVVAALRVAERLGPGRTVATLLCDSGLKYLSTDLYSKEG